METKEQRVKAPYIERFNGNLSVAKGDYQDAITHYNKSLSHLKDLFENQSEPAVTTKEQAVKLIREIETMVLITLILK